MAHDKPGAAQRCFAARCCLYSQKLTKFVTLGRDRQRYCSDLTTEEDAGISCLELNAKTALVVIDLQEGILPLAGGPHRADDVVERAAVWPKVPPAGFPGGHGSRWLVGGFP
jgi:hypothetical protein